VSEHELAVWERVFISVTDHADKTLSHGYTWSESLEERQEARLNRADKLLIVLGDKLSN
jgi:hypothetical protein